MEVINLSDSDEEPSTASTNGQAVPPPPPPKINRPGPLSAKIKRMQINADAPAVITQSIPALDEELQDQPPSAATRQKRPHKYVTRESSKLVDSSKFLDDFDPETSLRERR